ncbi:RusA family crossover junction endodeoxyribonuclease [Tumebacillus permanentifrigoris]|uniref:Crossover junction endodeoxyribonuclease RusA n=1 Tax=Tumebacillus permanentifrigoris TaxID=378543 RepID=A0A316D6V9_9BACL|nr:RusA family crossover junction endodeoxyribonuclease [Tumebacillus permanentifrigoris]PWK10187.1 crossover junction endodeoxyribonuclease RusA [Tumebacillus permanentifrigoris]
MRKLNLTIPGNPPSMNHVYRNVSISRRVVTPDGKMWKDAVQIFACSAMQKAGWKMTKDEKVVAEVTVYWPSKRKRDVENIGKLLWDSLEGIVFDDDQWLLPRYMDFHHDKNNPRIEIVFYPLEQREEQPA